MLHPHPPHPKTLMLAFPALRSSKLMLFASAVSIASFLALTTFWLLMRHANIVKTYLGEQGLEILSKTMGLIIVAIAVELIISGIKLSFLS